MSEAKKQGARQKLILAGTELIRRQGFSATAIDQVCEGAGVSKGSFFYHFANKEELTKACLENWDAMAAGMEAGAAFQAMKDPLQRLQGYMDFFITAFSSPQLYKSCLAGTTVQEVADSHPELREAAQACFANAARRMQPLLAAAAKARGRRLDSAGLASLWMATLQGSLLLAKAGGDEGLIAANLSRQRDFIMGLLN